MSAKKVKKIEKNLWEKIVEPNSSDKFFVRNLWFFVAFLVPFILMYVCFAISKVSPYGDQQILVTDLWHQYYPFLVDFHSKLQEGGSLLWTWKSGGGTNYIALMAYYLASPLNFLSVFVPTQYLREFLAVITCVKIGCASLFFAHFVRIVYKKRDITVAAFGTMYALCAFIMGYYWNIIWLDTVALLPLVVAGTVAVLRDGKFKLYIITLALSVLANYYIGLFTCIFVLLISIVYCIVEYKNIKTLIVNFIKMAGFSAVALGLSAILTVPTAIALGNTHSSNNTFPATYDINIGATDDFAGTMQALGKIIANSVAFVSPTAKEGLPNIACGMIALFFGIMFLTCSKIKWRERIASALLLLFFMFSFIIRQLDFIWHGFHFPNMLPHRFSFLFSFVLIAMAVRLYMNIEHLKLTNIFVALGVMTAIIGLVAKFYEGNKKIVLVGTILITLLLAIWLIMYVTKAVPKQALAVALMIICLAEGAGTAYIGVKKVGTTVNTSYPLGTDCTLKVVEHINTREAGNEDLFHAEVTNYHTLNDNALIGINGISMFSSVVNSNITSYMEKFGLCGWVASNRYTYQESSPFTNMMLNIKYLISPNGTHLDTDHMNLVYQEGNVKLLQNQAYIPQGFMVNEDLLDYEVSMASANPFDNQNEIFRLATGLKGNIYEALELVSQGHTAYEYFPVTKNSYGNYSFELKDTTQSPHLKYNYTAPYDGTAYAYFNCAQGESVDLRINDYTVKTNYVKRPYIMQMGVVKEGDKLSVYSDLKDVTTGTAQVYCNIFNEDLFNEGMEKLSQSTLNCTKSTDTLIEGTIDVKEDGLFYTSISFDKGWKAYVDGNEVEITPVGDALVAFKLSQGHHDIKLKYCPKGFYLGMTITLVSILALALITIISNKVKYFKKEEKAKAKE